MTSELFRWQAAMGAISGALIADALSRNQSTWTISGEKSLDHATGFLSGAPVTVDLEPHQAMVIAVGLASGPSPLLVNPTSVELIDVIRITLDHGGRPELHDPRLRKAAELARSSPFRDAVAGAGGDHELAALVGAFAGLDGGLGAVPARLVSTTTASDGRRGRRYLCALVNRLLGIERPNWYDPRNRRGPKEVLPGLWLSNLFGLSKFTTDHPDGLVLSLCDEEGRIADHPNHVTFHLDDTPRGDANPCLNTVLDEVLDEISYARENGKPVLLHCRHGASRTGLLLRLLLVEELGLSAEDALTEAQCIWPHTTSWNNEWNREVERRAAL